MAEALRLEGVSVTRGRRVVLADARITADYGSILAVLGPNGAGKTTLLDAVAGFVPFAGSITLDGTSVGKLDRRARARRIAYVP
ncbi:MAG TPA: ATP-binding cassette domain-containing protein, partial [Polyangia bacterium]|nr:ATP-binding cassette domain-containing protein [Polyangia bacterium]